MLLCHDKRLVRREIEVLTLLLLASVLISFPLGNRVLLRVVKRLVGPPAIAAEVSKQLEGLRKRLARAVDELLR